MMMIYFILWFMMMNYLKYYFKYLYSQFILMLSLLFLFNFKFENNFNILVEYIFTINIYSYMLILLTLWIMSLIIMSMNYYNMKILLLLLILLMNILIMVFNSISLLSFYYFFESSLIIMFFLIIKWGTGINRILSSYYMLFYTMVFSLPLLMFMYMMILDNYMNLFTMMEIYYKINLDMLIFLFIIMTFLMKMPMFMFHSWLLKAHVEAPVFGSMILAAILLKLGTYGMIRFMYIFFNYFMKIKMMLLIYLICGSIILSLLTLMQVDLKIMVAYSSVVHMNMLMSSMLTFEKLSFLSAYMNMVSHGFSSSLMFFLVNIIYLESNSRLLMINKGLINLVPKLSLYWFLSFAANMTVPTSLNLFSELMMMVGMINWFSYLMYMLSLSFYFMFIYSLYMFIYIQHGKFNYFLKFKEIKMINYFLMMMHLIPLFTIFLNLNIFLN